MEVLSDEVNLMDLWRIIIKRKFLLIGFPLGFAICVLIISFLSPKADDVYESEAVVTIPMYQGHPVISNLDTENIINDFLREIKKERPLALLDSTIASKILNIRVEPIPSSDSKIKIVVQVKDEPQGVHEVMNKLMDYLQTNEYLTKRMNNERFKLQAKRDETKNLLVRAIKIRDEILRLIGSRTSIGFNPIDMEFDISEIRSDIIELDNTLALMNGYEFVTKSSIYKNNGKPKVVLNTLLAGTFGLFTSILLIFFLESLNKGSLSRKS